MQTPFRRAPRRILLVRHGRVQAPRAGWLDAAGVRRWLDDYAAADLAPGDLPPAGVRGLAACAGIVVASDLPRARASAERLATGGCVTLSPLLRETPVHIPAFGAVRLPLAAWALAIGARAAVGAAVGAPRHPLLEDAGRAQGAGAATWLAALTEPHGVVLAVTHVNVRARIATALGALGWRRLPGGRRFAHWSAWTFEPAAPAAGPTDPTE